MDISEKQGFTDSGRKIKTGNLFLSEKMENNKTTKYFCKGAAAFQRRTVLYMDVKEQSTSCYGLYRCSDIEIDKAIEALAN